MEIAVTEGNCNDIFNSLNDNDVIIYDNLKFKVKIDFNLEFTIIAPIKEYSFGFKLLIWFSSLIIFYFSSDYIIDLYYFFSYDATQISELVGDWLIPCILYLCFFLAHFVFFKKYINFLIELLFEKNYTKIIYETNFLKLIKDWKRSTEYPLEICVNVPKKKINLKKEISSSRGEEIMYWK